MRSVFWLFCTTSLLASLAGCGRAVMTTDDVVVAPGQPAKFVVSLDRQYMKASIAGAEVSFYVNNRLIGRAATDGNGVAEIRARVGTMADSYIARGVVDRESVAGRGRIFHWDGSRTAVAIDVDETISMTDYGQLFLTDLDTVSPPLEYSPAAVRSMQHDFEIVYLSARPRWLHEKTKVWLDRHGFPPGPILHASRFEACFHQERYKREMLTEFRREFPNLLIGVGDKSVDDRAYGDNRMLTVILDDSENGYRSHCVVLPEWRSVRRFFERYRDSLADARRLSAVIHANGMNLRSLFQNPQAGPPTNAGVQASEMTAAPPAADPQPPHPHRRSRRASGDPQPLALSDR